MADRRVQTRAPGPILSPRPRQTFNQPYPPSPGYRQSHFDTHPYAPPASPFHRHAHHQACPPFFPAHPFAPGIHRGPASPFMRPPPLSPFLPQNRPVPFNFPIPMPVPVFVLPVPINMHDPRAYQDDTAEAFNRQRAYPPKGPRVYPSHKANDLSPDQSRRTRVEIHHPDGTVEDREEDEPVIVQMDDEDEEIALKNRDEVPNTNSQVGRLQLEWKAARNTATQSVSHYLSGEGVEQAPDPVQQHTGLADSNEVLVSRAARDVVEPGSMSISTATVQIPKTASQAKSDVCEVIETSNGRHREVNEHDPTFSIRQTHDSLLPDMAESDIRSLTEADLDCDGAPSTVENTVRDLPQKYLQKVATPDDIRPVNLLTGITQYPVEEFSNRTQSQTCHSVISSPTSAGLPSPLPAQVMDRLLEVTGLSARQFMGMVERGEFQIGQTKK